MQPQILSRSDCLTDEEPRLRQSIEAGQERGEQRKALNVRELRAGMINIIQHHGPAEAKSDDRVHNRESSSPVGR